LELAVYPLNLFTPRDGLEPPTKWLTGCFDGKSWMTRKKKMNEINKIAFWYFIRFRFVMILKWEQKMG
jgi:hypothetical protein